MSARGGLAPLLDTCKDTVRIIVARECSILTRTRLSENNDLVCETRSTDLGFAGCARS